jgi:beta-phosphoglucomutase
MTPPPFRGVLMDLDGLVLDTEPTYCHAWQRAGAELGFEPGEDFWQGLFGLHVDDVERRLRDALGERFDRAHFHRSGARHWRDYLDRHGIATMPGFPELLGLLRRRAIPHALATNSEARFALECLERAGVAREFPVIVTRDQVARGKPAPDLFLEAARRLAVPPELCLALEDSETGLAAARAAGTVAVLVQRREAARLRLKAGARFCCASLHDVAGWIEA